jgi:hypothetical protein
MFECDFTTLRLGPLGAYTSFPLWCSAQTTLSIFVDTVNAVNKVGWYAKYTGKHSTSSAGCVACTHTRYIAPQTGGGF